MRLRSMTRGAVTGLALTLAALLFPNAAVPADLGPQGVIRQFCQADGNGQRVTISDWAALAPLLSWTYEPAWDTVTLITGYTVNSPQAAGAYTFAIDVRYTVVGQLTPSGLNPEVHTESVTYRVQPDEQGNWHILAPLPPPHLFVSRVDIDTIRRSLSNGGVNFLANSVFVWQMFQSAGWNVPYESTLDLLSGTAYRLVDKARPGDLVVYLREGAPYHVGLLEAQNQLVSSTLNAGIVRTPVDAFPGEVRYLRLGWVEADPTATPAEPAPAVAPIVRPTPTIRKNHPTPTATPKRRKKKPTPSSKRGNHTKHSNQKRVPPKPKSARKHPRPTPGASEELRE